MQATGHYCPPVASSGPIWSAGDGPDGGGLRPGFTAKGSGASGVNKELTCKWGGRKRAGLRSREFEVSGQTLLRLDWGGCQSKAAPGAEALNKENKDG